LNLEILDRIVVNHDKVVLTELLADDIQTIACQIGIGKVEHWDRNNDSWEPKYNQSTLNPRAIYRTKQPLQI